MEHIGTIIKRIMKEIKEANEEMKKIRNQKDNYFDDLDIIIQEHATIPSEYDEGSDVDDVLYEQLTNEINAVIRGTKEYKDLSPKAKDIMDEWEEYKKGVEKWKRGLQE